MKFYQRHPIIFMTELVLSLVYYATPLLLVAFSDRINDLLLGSLAIAAQGLFWLGGWMYIPLLILAPLIIILIVNTIISFFDPLEQIVGNDDYSKWVKSNTKV